MCDDHQIGETFQDIVRTYNWLFIMTHLLLEAHGTFGHYHEGHGLLKGHLKFLSLMSPVRFSKTLALLCMEVYCLDIKM